jgi:4-amino-4-deoxy-L-arabinose transferase-like glycosyltransferase
VSEVSAGDTPVAALTAEPMAAGGEEAGATPPSGHPPMTPKRFAIWMAMPIGIATLIQVLYLWNIHKWAFHNGDATYYDLQANLMTHGHMFVNPYLASYGLGLVPSASHPPMTTLVLTAADELGATSWLWHQTVMALFFVITVALCGVVGRRMAGPRAGIVTALVVATDPYLWVNPGAVLAESVELLIVALLLWAVLRFWARPRLITAGEIGLYLGLAALTRSELILFVVLIGIPLVLLCRGLSRMDRVKQLAIMGLLFVVVVGPWVGRNMTAFHRTEYLSTQGGVTLATANCNPTYFGDNAGWWNDKCYANIKFPRSYDESDMDHVLRKKAEHYIETHKSRAVQVIGIRVARIWDVYRPFQQAQFDQLDTRPAWVTDLGTWYFYALVPFAVAGVVFLRRRKVLLFPLIGLIITATIAGAVFYSNGRYRTEGDLGVAILGAMGIEALIRSRWRSGAK